LYFHAPLFGARDLSGELYPLSSRPMPALKTKTTPTDALVVISTVALTSFVIAMLYFARDVLIPLALVLVARPTQTIRVTRNVAADRPAALLLITGLVGCVLERLGLSFALLLHDFRIAFSSFLGGFGCFFQFIRAVFEFGFAQLFLFRVARGEAERSEGQEGYDFHILEESRPAGRQDVWLLTIMRIMAVWVLAPSVIASAATLAGAAFAQESLAHNLTMRAAIHRLDTRSEPERAEFTSTLIDMNHSIFYIIGVIVVVVAILKFVGVW
jgi:hypothetical protein